MPARKVAPLRPSRPTKRAPDAEPAPPSPDARAAAATDGHSRRLFGTDGVRGTANQHPMTCEVALALGRAVAYQARRGSHRHRIVIGKDTRLSGYMIEMAFASGVCSMGVDALLVGPMPTPGVAFLTQNMRADAGVVISASHNPYLDNGIKIFARDGFKLPDDKELELEQLMEDERVGKVRPTASAVGKAFRIDDAMGRYIVSLKQVVPSEVDLSGMRVVVDCAHGAAYKAAPTVLGELGAQVFAQGTSPDGRNINRRCGALHPETLRASVLKHRADIGLALDGDADRLIVVDDRGEVVDGDALLAMGAQDLLAKGALRGKTVVATVMSNLALDRQLEAWGASLFRTQVGDRYVVSHMREHGLIFGGEQSGHLVYLEHSTTGDGLLAGLKLLASLREHRTPLSERRQVYRPFPQLLVNIDVGRKEPIASLPKVTASIARAEAQLGALGRVMVRFSGTEKKVRVLVEGPSAAKIQVMADSIAQALREALG